MGDYLQHIENPGINSGSRELDRPDAEAQAQSRDS